MTGLGAYQTAIPPGCWNTPGFRDCATTMWALAQKVCANSGTPTDECAGPLYDAEVMGSCSCDPPLAPAPDVAQAAQKTAGSGVPGWVWVLVGGAALYMVLDKQGKK